MVIYMKIMRANNCFSSDVPFEEFYVNSCGYYSDVNIHTKTNRPEGRLDFQLICVTEGKLFVKSNGKYCEYKKGSVILFKPEQPQIYKTLKNDNSAYFWIHFNGSIVNQFLSAFGFENRCSLNTTLSNDDIQLCLLMINEINLKPSGYQIKLLSLFSNLLVRILRHSQSNKSQNMYQKLANALSAMELEIEKAYSIKEYADMCNMSMHHFSHCFKIYTGQSPMQYRDSIAMNHAAYLLGDTVLPIAEIAAMTGFSDPLYFSKKFKKTFGKSPREYRKHI